MQIPIAFMPLRRPAVFRPLHVHVQHKSLLHRRHFSSYLVTPKELDEALKKNAPTAISTSAKVVPICAAWFMPNDPDKRTGRQVFLNKRIPTARFFDIDDIKDQE